MMKKIFKATIALLLAVNVVTGVGADTVKAGNFTFSGEFVRVFYRGEELYLYSDDSIYQYPDGSELVIEGYATPGNFHVEDGVDYGIIYDGHLYHYNTWEQINANNDNGIRTSSAYIYGVDSTTHMILDGAIIYSIGDDTNVNSYDPSNRDKRPNATLEKYDFNEMVIYDWYSMGNYVRKE